MATIAIAGASGFVGQALAKALVGHHLIGLSRSGAGDAGYAEWRACDLFSLRDAEEGLAGASVAVYLVHSMAPSARLTQGSFQDLDLIIADNFARAAKKHGVSQIIYVGGLIPDEEELSQHLASRREVEKALAAQGVPLTALRAGLVLGPNGSSFAILENLVRRLPVMILPAWTANSVQPIALSDLVALIAYVAGRSSTFGQTYDVGGPDVVTYRELMVEMADALHVRRRMLPVRFVSPGLSKLWVSMVSGSSADLVGPLVESLTHSMVARDRRLQEAAGIPGKPSKLAIAEALRLEEKKPARKKHAPSKIDRPNGVRSVQRLPLPAGRDAEWVAQEYMRWLPNLKGIEVEVTKDRVARFFAGPMRSAPLLELTWAPYRSAPDRQLFYITGGALAKSTKRGRLEFRETGDRKSVVVAIHDFEPRLPWLVYKSSQALAHLAVMHWFGKHLAEVAASS